LPGKRNQPANKKTPKREKVRMGGGRGGVGVCKRRKPFLRGINGKGENHFLDKENETFRGSGGVKEEKEWWKLPGGSKSETAQKKKPISAKKKSTG